MSIYNEILVGRYARGLQKLFSMKGEVPTKQLAGDLQAVHQVFNGAENRYLEGWNRFGALFTVAGVATFTSAFQLVNPVSNNIIIVIEKAGILPLAAAGAVAVSTGFINANLATIIPIPNTALGDQRGGATPASIASSQNNSASVANLNTVIWQASQNQVPTQDMVVTDIQEFPLAPGFALRFVCTVVNQQINPFVWWRERFLEESERS